jgi:tetratricopeptide (TPR) repeat protein
MRYPLLTIALWIGLGLGTAHIGVAHAAGEAGAQHAKEGATALQKGNADRAVALFTEALGDTSMPTDRRAAIHNDRGVAYSRLNQPRAAIDDFNKSVQLFPENSSVYNNRGTVLLALGLNREALKDFNRALALAPGYAAAYSNRANVLTSLGDADGAIRDFSRAIGLNPQSPAPLNGRGRLNLLKNRPYAAIRDFSRAVTADARFAPGYRARAEARLAIERYDDAIEDLSRAIAFDATNADLYVARGYAYLAARNVSSAIKDFIRATELAPTSNGPLEGLALSQMKAEAYDDALNNLAKALEIDPRSAQAHAYRAVVYKTMGQPDLGAKDLDLAVKLDSERPEVLWAEGEIAAIAGNTDDAIAKLQRAVNAKPMLRDAATTLERLGGGAEAETEVVNAGIDRWLVVTRRGRYSARHPDYPKLLVPLEMMSNAQPRLLEWEVKKGNLKTIGYLRFYAGKVEDADGPQDLEQAAVVDLASLSIIAVETVRQGNKTAAWTWDDEKVVVKGIDGFTEEYMLRPKPKEVAQQTRREHRSGGWSQQWGWGDGRGRRPKSIFDLIFKGF